MRMRSSKSLLAAALGLWLTQGPAESAAQDVGWRWIGVKSDGVLACPPASGNQWIVEDLFPGTDSLELARFCLYRADSKAPKTDLPAEVFFESLAPDLMAVTPHGSELAEITWTAFRDHFLSQVGQVALPPGSSTEPAARVRLAVIDSTPTGEAIAADGPEDRVANSSHGPTILNIARDLICDSDETDCRARLTSRLVLAYECFNPAEPADCRNGDEGGFLGLVSEVAQAVVREVESFRSQPAEDRLVINLSVGWDPVSGGTEPQVEQMSAPVQAVYRALEYAACRGASVIAAAGNRGASPDNQTGPIMPASWEQRAAPSSLQCLDSGVLPAPGLDGPVAYRPLLYSVAGVQANGRPLANARERGAPRLAAFADHAVVELSDTGGPSQILTGTSVSAVVVSATAAVLWSYFPDRDVYHLMRSIYSAGTPLGRDAAYCLGGDPCPVATPRTTPRRDVSNALQELLLRTDAV